jgi:hypothetical protein
VRTCILDNEEAFAHLGYNAMVKKITFEGARIA